MRRLHKTISASRECASTAPLLYVHLGNRKRGWKGTNCRRMTWLEQKAREKEIAKTHTHTCARMHTRHKWRKKHFIKTCLLNSHYAKFYRIILNYIFWTHGQNPLSFLSLFLSLSHLSMHPSTHPSNLSTWIFVLLGKFYQWINVFEEAPTSIQELPSAFI